MTIKFASGLGDLSSIPGCVIPKTLKMVLDTSLLNTQQYKVHIKGKVVLKLIMVFAFQKKKCSSLGWGGVDNTSSPFYGQSILTSSYASCSFGLFFLSSSLQLISSSRCSSLSLLLCNKNLHTMLAYSLHIQLTTILHFLRHRI